MATLKVNRLVITAAMVIMTALCWVYYQHWVPLPDGLQWQPLFSESSEGKTPHVSGQQGLTTAPAGLDAIVITMLSLGLNSALEGATAVKSALMHSSRPLELHILCDRAAEDYFESRFRLFSRPAYDLRVIYYPITTEFAKERSERARIGHNYILLAKLFLHELIDVEKSLYIDTDMIFVVDPFLLWNTFSTFKSTTMLALPAQQGRASHAGEICSCVMLMHFDRMREGHFMPSSLLPHRTSIAEKPFTQGAADKLPNVNGPERPWLPFDRFAPDYGDQGIFHVIWTYRPDLFVPLSLRWDISHCRKDYALTLGKFEDQDGEDMTEDEQIAKQIWSKGSGEDLLIPGILHFNCQGDIGNPWVFKENHEENSFGAMVTVAHRYKWIWLNRGDGTARVTTTRKDPQDVQWLDQREASLSPGSEHKA